MALTCPCGILAEAKEMSADTDEKIREEGINNIFKV